MILILYKITRFLLYPIIYLADFIQNNLTNFFTPMNMGPVAEDSYAKFIKENLKHYDYILDFGCGAGFFSKLFKRKKYLGVEVNKNFILSAKKKYRGYNFKLLDQKCLDDYRNKINLVFINNVLHHLTDQEIKNTFLLFKKKLKPNTKIFIIEPVLPKSFFSLEFFMKVIDIGNNIKTKKDYLKILNLCFGIKTKKIMEVGIGHVLVLKGFLKK